MRQYNNNNNNNNNSFSSLTSLYTIHRGNRGGGIFMDHKYMNTDTTGGPSLTSGERSGVVYSEDNTVQNRTWTMKNEKQKHLVRTFRGIFLY